MTNDPTKICINPACVVQVTSVEWRTDGDSVNEDEEEEW